MSAEKRSWTKRTTIAPSPTAVAHRLTDPERTSPTAKTPGTLVSRMPSAPALWPARTNPSSSSATVPSSQSVFGAAPRKERKEEEEEEGERDPLSTAERRRLELAVGAVQHGDLAASSDEDGGALEVVDQVVRHRLARSARRWKSVASAPPRASQIAAWAAELPPPTTPTRIALQRRASCGPAA